ncbi:MAG: NAD(P)/FAD-dependent oxidoreductase [Gemmatimonadales bacterium]
MGAGAAGLTAALWARRSGYPTLLLERTRDGGRKILISGGGRCNILPSRSQPERFVTDSSPSLLRMMLEAWPLEEQRVFFERELGMRLVLEEETGKLFPESQRARDVRDRLLHRIREAGAEVRFGSRVLDLAPPQASDSPWMIRLEGGDCIPAAAVIVATGGCSVPTTGSDGALLEVLQRLGHTIHPTYPALTPLLAEPAVHAHLAGVSLEVTIRAPGHRPRFETTGGFLFTHRGYSGPAVLDASHLAVRSRMAGGPPQALTVQWTSLDRAAWERALRGARGTVVNALARQLPARLAETLAGEAGIARDQQLAQLSRPARQTLVGLLTAYSLPWTGDEGYRKAEVTGGGVALSEVRRTTMESRHRPGLYLCGEILDAFGPIGGHNFMWAWATGRAAGSAPFLHAEPG